MARPFFSVVLPTKNRSSLLKNAIQSLLNQTFEDFEIVVADNDDTGKTADVVSKFKDERIQYFRSGNLTMPDNWEFAYGKAKGEYWALLEDKSVMKPRALKKISEAITTQRANLISWPQDIFYDLSSPPKILKGPQTGDLRTYESDEVLKMFMSQDRRLTEMLLPRGLNSCLHRDLAAKILSSSVGRLCPPYAPDYTLAFLQLAFADRLTYIDDSITVYGSCYHSNGKRTMFKEVDNQELGREFGMDSNQIVELVPLKSMLTTGILYTDFLRLRAKVGGRLSNHSLDFPHFFLESRRDIADSEALGVDMQPELQEWKSALAKQPEEVQTVVNKILFPTLPPLERIKKLGRNVGLDRPWHAIKRSLGMNPQKEEAIISFPTPSDYIEWEDSLNVGKG